jgi:glutamate mutase epsilon subunit
LTQTANLTDHEMLDLVNEQEVAALHTWIERVSDIDVNVADVLNNNFIRDGGGTRSLQFLQNQ